MKRLIAIFLCLLPVLFCACTEEKEPRFPLSGAIAVIERQLEITDAQPTLRSQSPDGATYFSKLFDTSKSPAE